MTIYKAAKLKLFFALLTSHRNRHSFMVSSYELFKPPRYSYKLPTLTFANLLSSQASRGESHRSIILLWRVASDALRQDHSRSHAYIK